MSKVKSGKADYFAAGQTSCCAWATATRRTPPAPITWVPFTDANGAALPGALTITDVERRHLGRRAQHDRPAAVQGHRLPAPRRHADPDGGRPRVPVRDDDDHERGLPARPDRPDDLASSPNRNTIDLATGLPVGSALASPDNLAIDHDGNIYIIEDRNGGVDNDIWFAKDLNQDGDLTDAGEGIGALGQQRHARIGVHRPVLRPAEQAPRLGQHPASRQRQRPHDRNHDPARRRTIVATTTMTATRPRSR